jgi:hypothetical protein
MDNNAQKPGAQFTTNRGGIPVEPMSTQPVQKQATPQPMSETSAQAPAPAPQQISSKGKEHEPAKTPFPDVVKMNEAEIKNEEREVERELEAIIEQSPQDEKPKIPAEAAEAGLEPSDEDRDLPPVLMGPTGLPMTYDEAAFIRKRNRFHWKNSIAWLASIIMYHWKKLNMVAKKRE